jgi:hypothetical protein
MRGGRASRDFQAIAVIEEYRKALADGRRIQAALIFQANADLRADICHAIEEQIGAHNEHHNH